MWIFGLKDRVERLEKELAEVKDTLAKLQEKKKRNQLIKVGVISGINWLIAISLGIHASYPVIKENTELANRILTIYVKGYSSQANYKITDKVPPGTLPTN